MGSYAYCLQCDRSLNKPTLRQALGIEVWACSLGHTRVPIQSEKESIADEFEALTERIEKIERHLWPENEE